MTLDRTVLSRRRFIAWLPQVAAVGWVVSYQALRPDLAPHLRLRTSQIPHKPANALRLATWNLRNFTRAADDPNPSDTLAGHDLERLRLRLAELDADILGLQEIRNRSLLVAQLGQLDRDYECIFSRHGGRHEQHVAICFDRDRFELSATHEHDKLSLDGKVRPALEARLLDVRHQRSLALVVVHLKAKRSGHAERQMQHERLTGILANIPSEVALAILGDFNVAGGPEVTEAAELDALVSSFRTSALELVEPDQPCSAYWEGAQQDERFVPSRLDLVWTRGFATAQGFVGTHCRKEQCGVLESSPHYPDLDLHGLSDHCPVVVDVAWP